MPNLIEITDLDDVRIEVYRDIRERDLVGHAGLFVAEGKVVVEKLADSALHQPISLLIASKRVAALEPLLARLSDEVPVYVATQGVIDAIAGFPLHRGILAIGHRTHDLTVDDLMSRIDERATVLVLCGVQANEYIYTGAGNDTVHDSHCECMLLPKAADGTTQTGQSATRPRISRSLRSRARPDSTGRAADVPPS